MFPDHRATIVPTSSLVSVTADLIDEEVHAGNPVVVLHDGALDAAQIVLELEQRGGQPLPQGGLVEFVHRGGGLHALRAAALRTGGHGEATPALIAVHPLVSATRRHDHGGCCIEDEPRQSGTWSAITCLFPSSYAATGGLTMVAAHPVVTVDGIDVRPEHREGRLLMQLLVLNTLDDPAILHKLAASPAVDGVDRTALGRAVNLRLSLLTPPAAADHSTSSAHAACDAARSAMMRADGQLEELFRRGRGVLGERILLEDAEFRPLAWLPGTPPPPSLSQVFTEGRLARLTGRLKPGVPELVRQGTPSAGQMLVMRIGANRPLGFLSATAGERDGRFDVTDASLWLGHIAPLLAAELLRRASWSRLRAESRSQLITMLVQGVLSPPSAQRALEVLVGTGGVRVAAFSLRDGAPGDPSVVTRHLERLGVPWGEYQGLTVGLLNGDEGLTPQVENQLFELPISVGIGSFTDDPTGLPVSARHATWTCRMAVATRQRVLHFTGIGIHRLFLPGAEGGDPSFEEPIRRLEEQRDLGFDGLHTLTGFLDSGANMRRAADQLVVHVNTLRYRLRRIAEVMQTDLADPEQRFRLQLAVRLRAGRRALCDSDDSLPPWTLL